MRGLQKFKNEITKKHSPSECLENYGKSHSCYECTMNIYIPEFILIIN